MKISARHLKIIYISVASLLVLIFVGGIIAYNKREAILASTIKKAIAKAKREYNLNVTIKKAGFTGLRSVGFEEIVIVPEQRDSLARINKMEVGVKLWPLLFGDVKLANLNLEDAYIHLIKKDTLRNYDFLFKKKKDTVSTGHKTDLATLANNLLNQALYKIPDDMNVKNLEMSFRDDSNALVFNTTTATIDGGDVKSTILVNNTESTWHVDGSVDPGDKQLDLKLYADGKKVELPLIEKKYNLKLNFDTVRTVMKDVDKDGSELHISGSWSVKNLLVNQPRIAANDIIVPDGSIDADMTIGENYLGLDSTSVIHLKNVTANPFIRYTLGEKKKYELKLHTDELDAQELFDAFPIGLFEALEGTRVEGKLQYDMNFYLDAAQPDSVKFDSRLRNYGFKVLSWGKNDLSKINRTFVYTPYEYGKPMRDITVGPENPNFTPIQDISPYLKNAVLTAEDPSFYRHKGFVEESIRKSIATNFKEKSFKRGGSTISMQLVKNVYLNRQKTLARKIEEILLVWIIENTHVSSKQRMFEVYLNLIEWGRNVYGIGEASRYYFDKSPSQLNIGESIYLASIVPRPKSSLYFFEWDGSLRSSLRGYFRLIGNLMARKGEAQPDSSVYGFYNVRLKPSLRSGTPPLDSLQIDSLLEGDEMEDDRTFLEKILGKPKRDTITINELNKAGKSAPVVPQDTAKTPSEIRQEKREERQKLRDLRKKRGY